MAVDLQGRAWQALCFQDRDYQAHVKAYWNEQFRIAAEIGNAKTKAFSKVEVKPYNVGPRDWYERGHVSPTEQRYPSITEDPTAYILAGD